MHLLLIDDDAVFGRLMARQLTAHGLRVQVAADADAALAYLATVAVDRIVLDLNLGGSSGLTLLPRLRQIQPDVPVVLLTGYASVATAVDAIKLGATHYLAKPVSAVALLAAFEHEPGAAPTGDDGWQAPSVARLTWEHIQQTLARHDGNISAAARALGMHRRTLQRRLAKKPVGR